VILRRAAVIARPQRGRGALSAKREEVPLGCNFAVPGRITGKPPANMVPLHGGASRTPPPTRCVRSAMACTSRKCLPEIATSLCSSQWHIRRVRRRTSALLPLNCPAQGVH